MGVNSSSRYARGVYQSEEGVITFNGKLNVSTGIQCEFNEQGHGGKQVLRGYSKGLV